MVRQTQVVIYEGYLGRDPELIFTKDGKAQCRVGIGSSRGYKNAQGEDIKETTWINFTLWDKRAEFAAQYLKKGSHVIVEGRLLPDAETGCPRVYQTKEGEYKASFEMRVNELRLLDKSSAQVSSTETEEDDSKLPF